MPISEIWGVGGRNSEKLNALGIFTVEQFAATPSATVRKLMTVTGQRTHAELLGVSCMPLTLAPDQKQTVAVTRMFGRPVETWEDMREALAAHASRAAEKVRKHGLVANAMQVFFHTHPHNGAPWYHGQRSFEIEPTSDSFALIRQAVGAGRSIWKPNTRYAKAGVILLDLQAERDAPRDLLPTTDPVRSEKLMDASARRDQPDNIVVHAGQQPFTSLHDAHQRPDGSSRIIQNDYVCPPILGERGLTS